MPKHGGLREWWARQVKDYSNGEDRPLNGYLSLMSVYFGGVVAATATARALGRHPRTPVAPWDVVQLIAATHKLSRTLAKDPVTSPLRAPFTTYEGVSAPSELSEQVRGHGLQHSVGELITCPMCLAQWVATGLCAGLVLAPAPTRLAMTTLTAVAGSDFLQHTYAALQQLSS